MSQPSRYIKNEFSRKIFMYSKKCDDIKVNNNNILMSRAFSFAMIEIEREFRLNEICLTYYLRHM
jgi:hypothetical protein